MNKPLNQAAVLEELHHFIGGKEVAGRSGRSGEVFNPALGSIKARVPFANEAEAQGTPVPFEAAEAADIVSTMMIALPHLFPEGSDFWSEAAEAEDPTSVTLALPTVWDDFDNFYREANAVADGAAGGEFRPARGAIRAMPA